MFKHTRVMRKCLCLAVALVSLSVIGVASQHVSDLSGTYRFSPDMPSGTAELFSRYGGPVNDYVHMYLRIDDRLTSQDNVLRTNQRVCKGSTIRVAKSDIQQHIEMEGGFETESCPGYRPFVSFLGTDIGYAQLDALKRDIEDQSFSTAMPSYSHSICSSAAVGSEVKDEEGRPTGFASQCTYSNRFICDPSCDVNTLTKGLQKTEGEFTYQAVKTGNQTIQLQCSVECILHVDDRQSLYGSRSGTYGYMEVEMDHIPEVNKTFSVQVQERIAGPSLEVKEASLVPNDQGGAMLSLTVANTGDVKAYLDDISLNAGSMSVIDDATRIQPGQQREILLSLSQPPGTVAGATLEFAYSSNAVNCNGQNTFSKTYAIQKLVDRAAPSCGSTADCATNQVCCNNACRTASLGVCEDIDGDGQAEWITQSQ